ncbi:alternative ribosome rescue aminoacyl-tRNA hydrolase ArfB [uncultured Prochlorococcus sp.]|jgi:ribosome-associated protein|uniref:alternative ribosome rescue aminoacyl-tRNA hydrolase ArfB n=1 Tax=Prochlorococcus sp. TaxID=1220 RepID=UPI000DFE6111|nr:alternative ribosome rescue aminoacyl-tRNA hydrolase ArfB [uncultured Prochlorococcus sp.]MDC3168846.1 alternative ribosome rescue aminoacyl-tRNA hydrolase ArfB [Prochlorococcus sp. AH-716-E17]RCL48955.1 MAG: aminoacyl-tRNA hydrolase [Prochlorococcus sp. MED-G72]|tara:strand:- start:2737 stop:3153 length:417 start_codon:yes stop_codon:yes gene_type:complete
MDLIITSRLVIPSRELKWRFSRSSGPGGQKVNKTNTRVEIIFNIEESKVLNDYQKKVLTKKLKTKLVNNCICLAVQEERNQLLNRQIAIIRISSVIRNSLKNSSKVRKATKPSKASQNRRLDSKKKRGELKKNRQRKY